MKKQQTTKGKRIFSMREATYTFDDLSQAVLQLFKEGEEIMR
jgi:hypothetical protein